MNPELLLLNLHTRGIVIKGVKNIANHNISPIVSIYIEEKASGIISFAYC